MSFKELASKRIKKSIKFMGGNVEIKKLTVAEVKEIQEMSKTVGENEEQGFEVLKFVVSLAVEGSEEMTDADYEQIPLEELDKLAKEITKYSGLSDDTKN